MVRSSKLLVSQIKTHVASRHGYVAVVAEAVVGGVGVVSPGGTYVVRVAAAAGAAGLLLVAVSAGGAEAVLALAVVAVAVLALRAAVAVLLALSVSAVDVALLALAVVAVAVGALDDARRAAGLVAVAVAARRGGIVDEVHGHEGRHHQEHVHGAHLACLVDARETLDRLHLFPRTRRLVAAAAGLALALAG